MIIIIITILIFKSKFATNAMELLDYYILHDFYLYVYYIFD